MILCCLIGVLFYAGLGSAQIPTEEIREFSDELWKSDLNRMGENDLQYDLFGTKLFTYVNQARFTGTYARFLALRDYYNPQIGVAEDCGPACMAAQEAFLDALMNSRPIILLHSWLFGKGLATLNFKNELRQYFFLPYSRSGGPLDSSGFEHVFLGEISQDQESVVGFHNWVHAYYEEQDGHFVYGSFQGFCPSEVLAFDFTYMGARKAANSFFLRTSLEIEVALYTLCLLTRVGAECPVRRNDVDDTMTVFDMSGMPKTVGTASPNC